MLFTVVFSAALAALVFFAVFYVRIFSVRRRILRIFKGYQSLRDADPEAAGEDVWRETAARYYRSQGCNPERCRGLSEKVGEAFTDLDARQDLVMSRRQKVQEMTCRILIYEKGDRNRRLGVRETEKIYQAVEIAAAAYFKNRR